MKEGMERLQKKYIVKEDRNKQLLESFPLNGHLELCF
jgi:hypothetical protein